MTMEEVSVRRPPASLAWVLSHNRWSFSEGIFSEDTFTFHSTSGGSFSFLHIHFGCGHRNAGNISEKVTGIVGLDRFTHSLVTQLNSTIGGLFSYCLAPTGNDNATSSATSKMNFGRNRHLQDRNVVSTPISDRSLSYYVTLEDMSVGRKRLQYVASSSSSSTTTTTKQDGNIVIDSETTFTFIPAEFYPQLESAVKEHIKLEPGGFDPYGYLKLCYKTTAIDDLDAPPITFHFTGADLELKPLNTFVKLADDLVCFAITSNTGLPDGLAIFEAYHS